MAMLKGVSVTLYERNIEGRDQFKSPIYTETPTVVDNVLIAPVSSEDLVNELQLYGKHAVYELSIPKGDTHNWEDSVVEFLGHKWKTYGFCREWIEDNIPLQWNKKIKVERYA